MRLDATSLVSNVIVKGLGMRLDATSSVSNVIVNVWVTII